MIAEFITLKSPDEIVLEVKNQELGQAVEGLIADGGQPTAVQVQLLNPFPSDKCLTFQNAGEVVAVKEDGSRVHGDQGRDLYVTPE